LQRLENLIYKKGTLSECAFFIHRESNSLKHEKSHLHSSESFSIWAGIGGNKKHQPFI